MNDDQYFLANAYIDGELTDDSRRIAEADQDVMSEVDRLRSVQSLLRSTDRPSATARSAAIAAAMAEFAARPTSASLTADGVSSTVTPLDRRRPKFSRYIGVAAAIAAVGMAGLVVAGVVNRGSDDDSDESSLAVTTETLARTAPEAASLGSATTLATQMEMDAAAADTADASDSALAEAPAASAGEEGADSGSPMATVAAAETAAGDSAATTLKASMNTPYATTGGPIEPVADRDVTITSPGELAGLGTLLANLRDAGTLGATPETSCVFDDARDRRLHPLPVSRGHQYGAGGTRRRRHRRAHARHRSRHVRDLGRRAVALRCCHSQPTAWPATVLPMPGNPLTDPNWAQDLTEQITTLVGTVRDKTTNNAVKAARAVVFGLIALFLGSLTVVLTLLVITRGLQSLINIFTTWERSVYLSYFVSGAIFTLIGLLLMSKRDSKA